MKKQYYQDGADFYDENTGKKIASYRHLVKNDFDLSGAKKAEQQFLKDHPEYEAVSEAKQWPPTIKGVHDIAKGNKVRVKNTHKTGEIVDFDETTATIKFKNGKTEKFGLNKLTFLFEQAPNSIGAEIGSEPTVHNKKFRYNFDSPYAILPLDVARKIGEFVHIDFDHIKVEDLFAGMKTEAKKMSEAPKTIKDWIKVAKIAKSNLDKDTTYYSDWVSEAIRKVIREEIQKILKEGKFENFKKDWNKASNDRHDIEYAQEQVLKKYNKYPELKSKIDKFLKDFEKEYS